VKFYTVHLRVDQEPVLVREGFSWLAAIFGPVWLFFNAAWIAGGLVFGADLLLGLLPQPLRLAAWLFSAWAMGLFGTDLVCWNLGLRGHAMPHVIAARDLPSAEARLFDARPELAERGE
jgi:hypothetical protein